MLEWILWDVHLKNFFSKCLSIVSLAISCVFSWLYISSEYAMYGAVYYVPLLVVDLLLENAINFFLPWKSWRITTMALKEPGTCKDHHKQQEGIEYIALFTVCGCLHHWAIHNLEMLILYRKFFKKNKKLLEPISSKHCIFLGILNSLTLSWEDRS